MNKKLVPLAKNDFIIHSDIKPTEQKYDKIVWEDEKKTITNTFLLPRHVSFFIESNDPYGNPNNSHLKVYFTVDQILALAEEIKALKELPPAIREIPDELPF